MKHKFLFGILLIGLAASGIPAQIPDERSATSSFRRPATAPNVEFANFTDKTFDQLMDEAMSTPAAIQKSELDGTYTLDEADSDNINKVIEDAVGKLNFLTRQIARGRLKKLNPSYHQVTIASSPNEMSVSVDDQPPLRTPAKGTPVAWTGPDGGKVNVSMQLAGGRLVQTFTSADGRRVNVYTLSPDGRMLTMQVTETSPRLSQAIRYKQVYRRIS